MSRTTPGRLLVIAGCVAVIALTLARFPQLQLRTFDVAEDVLSAAREKLQTPFPFLRPAARPPVPRSAEPYTDMEGAAVVLAWKRHCTAEYPVILRKEIRADNHIENREVPDSG